MKPTEFETHTGVYPDRVLYDVIEREYERQDENGRDIWPDKHTFCNAYKFNEDGLAERIQAAANEAIWQMEERHRKALNESGERVRKLYEQNARLEAEVEALHAKLEEAEAVPRLDPITIRKAQRYQTLADMATDEATAEEVLHAVWAFICLAQVEAETAPKNGGDTE